MPNEWCVDENFDIKSALRGGGLDGLYCFLKHSHTMSESLLNFSAAFFHFSKLPP